LFFFRLCRKELIPQKKKLLPHTKAASFPHHTPSLLPSPLLESLLVFPSRKRFQKRYALYRISTFSSPLKTLCYLFSSTKNREASFRGDSFFRNRFMAIFSSLLTFLTLPLVPCRITTTSLITFLTYVCPGHAPRQQ